MARITDSRDPAGGLGFPILQHHGYIEKGFDLDYRGGIIGVRVNDRDDKLKGLGSWIREKREGDPRTSAGDLNLAFLWANDPKKRPIAGFAWSWPVVTVPNSDLTATPSSGDICAVAPSKPSMLPIGDYKYQKDERWEVLNTHTFPMRGDKPMWPKFPIDFFGVSYTTTEENTQTELFMPTDPRHVAVNRKGDMSMGSLVCDMGDDFKIDLDRMARLQSKDWVLKEPKTCNSAIKTNAIAWNIGPTGCEDTRGGFVFEKRALVGGTPTEGGGGGGGNGGGDSVATFDVGGILRGQIARLGNLPGGAIVAPDVIENLNNALNLLGGGGAGGGAGGAGAPPPSVGSVPQGGNGKGVIALISQFDSGHSDVGSETDKHNLGMDADGHPINSLHLHTNSYFRRDDTFDAPLEFGSFYVQPERGRYIMPVYLRYDPQPQHPHACGPKQGLWRWESECVAHIIDGGPQPVPPPPFPPVATGASGAGAGGGGGGPPPGSPPDVPGVPIIPTNTLRQWMPGRFDAFVAMETAFSVPALIGRPQSLKTNAIDQRQANGFVPHAIQEASDKFTPGVFRMEAFGSQTAGEWNYTQRPMKGRLPGGTANGGIVLMPPEFDITDYSDNFSRNASILPATSTTYFVAVPGAYWAGGLPVPSTGGIKTGYRWGTNSSGDLSFDRVDSSGTATNVATLESDGTVALPADTTIKMGSGSGTSKAKGTFYTSPSAVGNVGTGEDTLHTFDLTANAMSSNNSDLHISAHGSFAAAATVTLKFYFGSASGTIVNASSAVAGMNWAADIHVIRVSAGTQTIRIRFWASSVDSSLSGSSYTRVFSVGASESESAAITVKFTGEATNNNDVVQNMTVAEFYNAP